MRVVAGALKRNPMAHALGQRDAVAVCGFYPSGLWGAEAPPDTRRCARCLKQLQRAGFGVSWANVIVADGGAS